MEIFIIVVILALGGLWWFFNKVDKPQSSNYIETPTVPPSAPEPVVPPITEVKVEEPVKPKRTRKPRAVKPAVTTATKSKPAPTKALRGRKPVSKKA